MVDTCNEKVGKKGKNCHMVALATSCLAAVAPFTLSLLDLETTNAATTYYSLRSLMGMAGVLGAPFAVVLTVGLAALDTGGLMYLFGPESEKTDRTSGLWFVMLAWLVCATTNSILTWWTVASPMTGAGGNALLSATKLLDVAPPFVTPVLWVTCVLLVAGWAQGERG